MPHQVALHPAPTAPLKMSAPPVDGTALLLHTVFTAQTSQEVLDASYALSDKLRQATGFRGLSNVLHEVKAASTDKKDGAKRESAMILFGALLERFLEQERISEIIFLDHLHIALDLLADKGKVVRDAAKYAIDALYDRLSPESLVVGLIPTLIRYLEKKSGKWQGAVGAYALLGRTADKAKMGTGSRAEERSKDLLRESMGKHLAGLIPVVETGMHDLKAEVRLPINAAPAFADSFAGLQAVFEDHVITHNSPFQ